MSSLHTLCREYGTKLPEGVGKTAYRHGTTPRQVNTEVPISGETGVVATLTALDAGDYILQHHTDDTYYGIHEGVAQSFVYSVHTRTACALEYIPEDICPPSLRDSDTPVVDSAKRNHRGSDFATRSRNVLETVADDQPCEGQAPIAQLKEQDNNAQIRYTITD